MILSVNVNGESKEIECYTNGESEKVCFPLFSGYQDLLTDKLISKALLLKTVKYQAILTNSPNEPCVIDINSEK